MAVLAGLVLFGALAACIVIAILVARERAARRESERVRAVFARYVAPSIVEEVLRRDDPRPHAGRSMRATILVCRIWNFAGFTEALSAPETLRYLNEFYALAGTSIQRYAGTIDAFVADGIVGVFGAPLEDPDAEEHALRAALDIVRLVDAIKLHWRGQGRPAFEVGIGVSTGDAIVGDVGFEDRREFTVVGPDVLYAARLQEATSELRASIVAADATCERVAGRFSLVPITGRPLSGMQRLTDACIVVGATESDGPPLSMPAPSAFRRPRIEHTVVASPAPPVTPATPAAPPARPLARVPSPTPAMPPSPLTPLRRRSPAADAARAASAASAAFAAPDDEIGFGPADNGSGGPPIGLPP